MGLVLGRLRSWAQQRLPRVRTQHFLRVLGGLQPWELCLPDLCVAIEVHGNAHGQTSPRVWESGCFLPVCVYGCSCLNRFSLSPSVSSPPSRLSGNIWSRCPDRTTTPGWPPGFLCPRRSALTTWRTHAHTRISGHVMAARYRIPQPSEHSGEDSSRTFSLCRV